MILQNVEAKPDQVLWQMGETCKFAICIMSGEYTFIDCAEAEKNIVFKTGNFVGEVENLINSAEHTTSLKALTKGSYFKLDRIDLLGFLRRNPGLLLSISEVKYII